MVKSKEEIEKEIKALKKIVRKTHVQAIELDKDLREARTLLFIALGVLMALFGLLMGVLIKMIA